MTRRRIYLAGPDVFHSRAAALGQSKKDLCAEYGFAGLFPLDHPVSPGPDMSRVIYAGCVTMMREADAGIFSLTPFRGPSADVGTAFELGMMVAMGKPVFAYTNAASDLIDRLQMTSGLAFDEMAAIWRDPQGMAAEDFGNADNLMLDEALAAQGRKIHRRDVPMERQFTQTDGFRACLIEAKAYFAVATATLGG